MIGIFTALAASQTSLIAMGLMHGPVKPPVTFASFGLRVSMSMAIAGKLFAMARPSLPASSAAFANGTTLGTFGLSLVISGSVVASRQAVTTWLNSLQSVPNWAPPSLMFGQETLSSSAPTPPSASNRRATSAYYSTVGTHMLIMVGTGRAPRNGQ
jgi:hypothetical protein